MRLYIISKPPSVVDCEWIHWSTADYKSIDPDSNSIAALIFIIRRKEIEIIYKPTPVVDDKGNLLAILGNMLDNGSTPAIVMVNGDKVGSCFTVQNFKDIPEAFRPEIPLEIDSVKNTEWATAKEDIALVVLPTLAPLPFGTDIKSTVLDDNFLEEMKSLSPEHEFWAKMMVDAHDHYATDYEAAPVVKNLSNLARTSTMRDPCQAATKGFRNITHALSGPIVETSRPGKSHEREHKKIKELFYRNLTPAHVKEELDDKSEPQIPVHSRANAPNPPTTAAVPPAAAQIPTQELYTQLLETMKVLRQAPPQQQKIVVKSREHEDSVDLAKLHNNMLTLFYVNGEIDWEEGTVKNLNLATFAQGFANLLSRTATVQETPFANLLNTVFTTQTNDDSDNPTNPLERLMSLTVFPKKFTKAHLNASFQCADLKAGLMYKNPSINPFHYGLQTNRALVKAASAKIQEERNQINWKINDKDKKVISSVIEGVGRIKTMDDVCMTCTNMCGAMLAIVDVTKSKPLLYQVAWKFIKLIENKKMKTWMRKNSDNIAHLSFVLMGKIHKFFQSLALFSQNLINTNKVELNNSSLNTKQIEAAVKLVTKFIKKMDEHADNNSVPKEIPPFAKSFFVEQGSGTITIAPSADLGTSSAI